MISLIVKYIGGVECGDGWFSEVLADGDDERKEAATLLLVLTKGIDR